MDLSAIRHYSGDNYCFPLDEDRLMIKLHTGKEVTGVTLVWGDPFDAGLFGSDAGWDGEHLEMQNTFRLQHHIVWQAVIEPKFKRCRYFFIVRRDDEVYYYNESGFENYERFAKYSGRRQDFYFPWMNSADIIKPADWVSETVWYQIFPDRYCSSGKNVGGKFLKWAGPDQVIKLRTNYGGDLPGIISKLDHIRDLGITGLYFTPMNQSISNHKYNTTDYLKIDSDFGTNEDMKTLVKEAHKRGIRVMLDGVFNHSGINFAPFQDVLENGRESKYFDWFMINSFPFNEDMGKAIRGEYYSFAFNDGMPKLNTNNDEVIDYFVDVCRRWVNEYDIDALRLDVANEISHKFNKKLREAMFAIKPDFYICGEIWHDSKLWLRGDEFDSVMNYSLQENILSFWSNPEMTAEDFEFGISSCFNSYADQTCKVMFNLLDSHDTIRLITRCDKDVDAFYQQFCVLFTLSGSVCVYYGTEVRLEGGYDPDCRRCMPWKEISEGLYDDRIDEMKKLIAMRRSIPELYKGDLRFIPSGNDRVIIYEKFGENTYRVALNCSGGDIDVGGYSDVVYARGLDGTTLKHGGAAVLKV